MSKKKSTESHKADQLNKNIGRPGINIAYSKGHGNRSKQLDPKVKKK